MIFDLNMWKNQIFYYPEAYGQYTGLDINDSAQPNICQNVSLIASSHYTANLLQPAIVSCISAQISYLCIRYWSTLQPVIVKEIGIYLYLFFKKMRQSRPLFVYFRSFLITISIIQIEKSIDGVLGIQTWGRRMVGADETTELWRPPWNLPIS